MFRYGFNIRCEEEVPFNLTPAFLNRVVITSLELPFQKPNFVSPQQGLPTWCPRAPGRPQGPSRTPAGLFQK